MLIKNLEYNSSEDEDDIVEQVIVKNKNPKV